MSTFKQLQTEYFIVPLLIVTILSIYLLHHLQHPQLESDQSSTLFISPNDNAASPTLPNFKTFKNVKAKKLAFFDYLLPLIQIANKQVLAERSFVLSIQSKTKLSPQARETFLALAKKYKLKTNQANVKTYITLSKRIDFVPASLILAQAANESAWGTSRFAKEANNLFGIWCFTKGCGLTPKQRQTGLTHEVAKFMNIQTGVNYYVRMLNSNKAYNQLREIRYTLRQQGLNPNGADMAMGLEKYSERGIEYVNEIKAMIRINQLAQYKSI